MTTRRLKSLAQLKSDIRFNIKLWNLTWISLSCLKRYELNHSELCNTCPRWCNTPTRTTFQWQAPAQKHSHIKHQQLHIKQTQKHDDHSFWIPLFKITLLGGEAHRKLKWALPKGLEDFRAKEHAFSCQRVPSTTADKELTGMHVWGNTCETTSHNLLLPLFPEDDGEKLNPLFWHSGVGYSS